MAQLPDRNGNQVWRETGNFGPITYEVAEFEPPAKMVTVIANEDLPFGRSRTYEISPAGEGCTLTVTENGEIYNLFSASWLGFCLALPLLSKATCKRWGRNLAQRLSLLKLNPDKPRGDKLLSNGASRKS